MDESPASTLTEPTLRRVWRTYVTDVRAEANGQIVVSRATDRKMVIVFVTVALALTCNNFLSDGANAGWLESPLRWIGLDGVSSRFHRAMLVSSHRDWNQLAFWAVMMVVTYVVPAALVIRFVLHERIRDYGVRWGGVSHHARVYLVCSRSRRH
jgi:hypothetical protein